MKSNSFAIFPPFTRLAGDTWWQLVLTVLTSRNVPCKIAIAARASNHLPECLAILGRRIHANWTSCYYTVGVKLNPVIRVGKGWILKQQLTHCFRALARVSGAPWPLMKIPNPLFLWCSYFNHCHCLCFCLFVLRQLQQQHLTLIASGQCSLVCTSVRQNVQNVSKV